MVEIEQSLKRSVVNGATFVIGDETADVINVAVQFTTSKDGTVKDVAERVHVPWYLSDDVAGDSIVVTAPSGGIAIGTDGLLVETIANKTGFAVSESDGDLDVDIEESGTDTFYLVLVMPDGSLVVSGAITMAA